MPEWEWSLALRGWVFGLSSMASSILVWYALFPTFNILLPQWSLAGTVGASLLLYFAVGAVVMTLTLGIPGLGGAPIGFYFYLVVGWPSWSTWIGTCFLASGWCLIFD
ncbi:MAG: hypothetical protein ACE5KQ_04880 [Thermoplasmata archaeon]